MTSTSLFRVLPFLAALLPVAQLTAGCGTVVHNVGQDDGGTGSGSGGGSCTGANPGCCGIGADGCETTVAEATCTDGAWKCGANESVGPACPTLCEARDGGGPPVDGGACVTPVVGKSCTSGDVACATPPIPKTNCPSCAPGELCVEGQGWFCGPGDVWAFSGVLECVSPDAGTGGCSDPNPGCCGLDSQGCEAIVAQATCSGSTWACPAGDTLGPACPAICEASDGGGGPGLFACGPDGGQCDSATQYCHIIEGGAQLPDGGSNVHGTCETIPSQCANDPAGAAATCACINSQSNGVTGSCSVTDGDITITEAVP